MDVELTIVLGRENHVGADERPPRRMRAGPDVDRLDRSGERDGSFREDLYYRLNVVELLVPPLRERREDVLQLVRRLAQDFVGATVRLSPQAVDCLLAYDWPGNVRELRNAIQRACLLCRGDVVLPEHLPPKIQSRCGGVASPAAGRLSQVERAAILDAVAECGGNRTQAARRLGISRRGLIYKLRAMDPPPPECER